jgi:hypothetical protein
LVDQSVGDDGRWGPAMTDSKTPLEFAINAPGFATTHIYRSPFARSSAIVNLRPERQTEAEKVASAVISLVRPRGYFGLPRDTIVFDGQSPPPDIPTGVAGVSTNKRLLADVGKVVVGEFSSGAIHERIVGRTWSARDGHVSVLELHH